MAGRVSHHFFNRLLHEVTKYYKKPMYIPVMKDYNIAYHEQYRVGRLRGTVFPPEEAVHLQGGTLWSMH